MTLEDLKTVAGPHIRAKAFVYGLPPEDVTVNPYTDHAMLFGAILASKTELLENALSADLVEARVRYICKRRAAL